MLLSIFQWLTEAIAGALDSFTTVFIECLNLDLSAYLKAFPLLADAYKILRTVGLGLTLVIAAVGLFNFLTLKSFEMRYVERPGQILIKAMIAAGFTYFGGYVLEEIVKIASFSFEMFTNLSGTSAGTPPTFAELFSQDALGKVLEMTTGLGQTTDLTLCTVALILVILIAYNLFKLILEVAERYMMVGVLVFTSPLVYCTMSTENTKPIFKRWVQMFISSCLMMSMSALFLRLIVNGLYAVKPDTGDYFLQLLLVLAMCKIAQRVDSYLNQLGLTTAVTGGGLLEDLAAVGAGIRMVSNAAGAVFGGKGSKSSILGGGGSAGARAGAGDARVGGLAGAAVNAFRRGREAFVNGGTAKDVAKAAGGGVKDTFARTPAGGAIKGGIDAKKAGQNVAAGAAAGAIHGGGEMAHQAVAPNMMNERRANMAEQAAMNAEMRTARGVEATRANAEAHREAADISAKPVGEPVSQDIKDRINDTTRPYQPSASEAADNFARYGVAEEGQSAMAAVGGARSEESFRAEAMQEMAGENSLFASDYAKYTDSQAGRYSEGDPMYMSAEAFNHNWGDAVQQRTNELMAADNPNSYDGAGMSLGDNARASGLSVEQYQDSFGASQPYVSGGSDQVGALLANEYSRGDPVAEGDGIKSDSAYRSMAMQHLETAPESSLPAGFDRDQFITDRNTMDIDDFNAKYDSYIAPAAVAARESDIRANEAANESYRQILSNTAGVSANASLTGLMDTGTTLEGNDRLGNAMCEKAFSSVAADRADGTSFSNISFSNRPDTINEYDGSTMHGGRVGTMDYIDRSGESQRFMVYDQTAYTSMTEVERSGLSPYSMSDGRTLWATVVPQSAVGAPAAGSQTTNNYYQNAPAGNGGNNGGANNGYSNGYAGAAAAQPAARIQFTEPREKSTSRRKVGRYDTEIHDVSATGTGSNRKSGTRGPQIPGSKKKK